MSINRRVTFADPVAAKLPTKLPEVIPTTPLSLSQSRYEGQPLSVVHPIKDKELKKYIKGESAPPDFKTCPDCQGSGFWYPEGLEKGVAKCKHERTGK